MSLIKSLRNLETTLETTLQWMSFIAKFLIPLGIICIISLAIWQLGPYVVYGDYAPLLPVERRVYLILLFFLGWLLKFLLIDLDSPDPSHYKQTELRKKLTILQKRFKGASIFLDKTPVSKQSNKMKLSELPCYLLLGPMNSGKTTLLQNAGIHFILQKQVQGQDMHHPGTSENCDWWVTREASIIDIPGKYLSTSDALEISARPNSVYSTLWIFFLRLMRKKRGKHGVNGIILVLPAPEILKQTDNKNYHAFLRDLFQQIQALQKLFALPLTCQLVITKCDLLPGFREFFAETSSEEATQAWGVTLPLSKENERGNSFTIQFNALIKNLNQQLLWRLHQERNPLARPAIKDFPLQMERIKEFTAEFIKKISILRLDLVLRGVYLTSAYQPEIQDETIVSSSAESSDRIVQIFKEPIAASRAYFVKQFFTHGMSPININPGSNKKMTRWKYRATYAASATCIVLAAVFFSRDFLQGVKQTVTVQQNLAEYQHKMLQLQNPDEELITTLHLLNTLQQTMAHQPSPTASLYSQQAAKNANHAYQNALHTILLPEIKNYFEDYLVNPINKKTDDVYAVLKTYLMLGDPAHFDATQITSTLQKILSASIDEKDSQSLIQHLQISLTASFKPLPLSSQKIQDTRHYLTALPTSKLSYIILKNFDRNNIESNISIQNNNPTPIFANQHLSLKIPQMFTAKMFNVIFSKQTEIAAKEAYFGNWILGEIPRNNAVMDTQLLDQLRIRYVTQYIETWQNFLENIHLVIPVDLASTDAMIASIVSNDSPFLHLLKVVHANTNFEPIMVASQKLQRLNLLIEKSTESQKTLFTVFSSMESLHQYLQGILHAHNIKQAAYEAVSNRITSSRNSPDAITQLRLIAENCPAPIRQWLVKITDNSWNYLLQEAGQYLDLSWNNKVMPYYRAEIADKYPFNPKATQEVSFQKFTGFFGSPGIVTNFYNQYLQRLVDTSTPDWHWKQIEGHPAPFSVETLRQIQFAMRIHQSFFPHDDNKLYVQFALQPYKFGKMIKAVDIQMNDEQFIDENDTGALHLVTLQGDNKSPMAAIQVITDNNQIQRRQFQGSWGWFKLLNQAFESVVTKKEVLLNLSMNEHPAKYILSSANKYNPFLSLNLQVFHLPSQLTDEKA